MMPTSNLGEMPLSPLGKALEEAEQDYAIKVPTSDVSSSENLDPYEEDYCIPYPPTVPLPRKYGPTIAYRDDFYRGDDDVYYAILKEVLNLPYESYTVRVDGRTYTPLGKVLAYADPGISYTFGSVTPQCLPWSTLLLSIKKRVEETMKCTYNHALLNYLPCPTARINCHRDNVLCLSPDVPIAMVSFATFSRSMVFNQKGKRPYRKYLNSGSLLTLYDQEWSHGMPSIWDGIDTQCVLITFRKIVMPATPATQLASRPKEIPIHPQYIDEFCPDEVSATQLASPEELLVVSDSETFEDAQHFPPLEEGEREEEEEEVQPPTKKVCLEIPENDWLTAHCQGVVDTTMPIPPENADLKKFWLSNNIALSVQIFEGALYIHIRQYYPHTNEHFEMMPTQKGARFDLRTFHEFSKKIEGISRSLKHESESTIVGNCVLLVVEDEVLHIRQFNDKMLHPQEVVLDATAFRKLLNQMQHIHSFIMDYMFNVLLKSKVCLPIPQLPYMKDGMKDLQNLIQDSVYNSIDSVFHCRQCFYDVKNIYKHDCRRLTYSEKYGHLPTYTPMLCNINVVAEEYLNSHSKLSYDHCNFTDIYKNLCTSRPRL